MPEEETGMEFIERTDKEYHSTNGAFSTERVGKIDFNPIRNDKSIVIEQQKDGNYRGFMWKNGKLAQSRAGDPSTVLVLLLTQG